MKVKIKDLLNTLGELEIDGDSVINVDIKNTKQYHAIRKIQKRYEISLNIAKSKGDVERQVELEKQLKVATECLEALFM